MQNEFLVNFLKLHSKEMGIDLPETITFDINIIRKTSEHRSVCLTILDDTKKKLAVLKFPQNKSEITNLALLQEFNAICDLQKNFGCFSNLPDPKGKILFDQRLFMIYEYLDHKMIFDSIAEIEGSFKDELFTIPIDWLFDFNKKSMIKKKLEKSFLDTFEKKLLSRGNNYSDKNITFAINKLWKIFKPKFFTFCKTEIPFVSMHGDFNPWNLGIGKKGQLVVFDWEDYASSFPILMDFFYFVIVFFWILPYIKEEVTKKNIADTYQSFYNLILRYLDLYQKEYPILTNEMIDSLFLFFLFNNTLIDLEEKRNSTPELVFRWLEIINAYKPGNFFLNYFSPESWVPVFQKSKDK